MILKNTIAYVKHKPSMSIGFMFSIGSLLLGIWVAALPGIKLRLGFTEGTLGLSLLLGPAGSLTAVALSGKVFSRLPAGRWLIMGYVIQCFVYIAQVMVLNRLMFWSALFAAGFTGCLNGIAANAVVNSTEKKTGRKIMSTSHGMYSLGGGISAAIAAMMSAIHVGSYYQILFVVAIVLTVLYIIRKEITSHGELIHSGSSYVAPPPAIRGLAFICFVTFMGEGCIADWSAIYLRETLNSSIALASLGFAGFSLMMAIGRFNGDVLVHKVLPRRIVMTGCLVAATGFLLVVTLPFKATAIAGFTLVGLGFSCIVPILFSAAANAPGLSPAMGIASIASGGLMGFLTGPAVIGFIAEKFQLSSGLSFVLVLSLLAGWTASRNKSLAATLIPSS